MNLIGPLKQYFCASEIAAISLFPSLYRLADANWALESYVESTILRFSFRLGHKDAESVRAYRYDLDDGLKDIRIVNIREAMKPKCIERLDDVVQMTEDSLASLSRRKLRAASSASSDADAQTRSFISELLSKTLGAGYGIFFFEYVTDQGRRSDAAIEAFLSEKFGLGPEAWNAESAHELKNAMSENKPGRKFHLLRPVQKGIMEALYHKQPPARIPRSDLSRKVGFGLGWSLHCEARRQHHVARVAGGDGVRTDGSLYPRPGMRVL